MAWSQARAGTAGGPQTPARHPLISVTSGSSAWISPEVPLVEWNVSFRGLRWVIGSNEGGACSTPPPRLPAPYAVPHVQLHSLLRPRHGRGT